MATCVTCKLPFYQNIFFSAGVPPKGHGHSKSSNQVSLGSSSLPTVLKSTAYLAHYYSLSDQIGRKKAIKGSLGLRKG